MSQKHKGDSGLTDIGNKRKHKAHPLFNILGHVDLLHAHMAHVIDNINKDKDITQYILALMFIFCNILPYYTLRILTLLIVGVAAYGQFIQFRIQEVLINKIKNQCILMIHLGSVLSFWSNKQFTEDIEKLDVDIEQMINRTPKLRNFIHLFGSLTVSQIHISRCVCRNLEQLMWEYNRCINNINDFRHDADDVIINSDVTTYINRLSLFLYHLSRLYNHELGRGDIIIRNI